MTVSSRSLPRTTRLRHPGIEITLVSSRSRSWAPLLQLLSGAKKGKVSGGLGQSANFATGYLRNLLILRTREIGDSPRREPQAYFAQESS